MNNVQQYACLPYRCRPGSVALIKTAGVSNWQTSKTCRSACGAACRWLASHITGAALTTLASRNGREGDSGPYTQAVGLISRYEA